MKAKSKTIADNNLKKKVSIRYNKIQIKNRIQSVHVKKQTKKKKTNNICRLVLSKDVLKPRRGQCHTVIVPLSTCGQLYKQGTHNIISIFKI